LVPRKVAIKLVLDQIEESIYTVSMFNRLFEDVEGILRLKFSEFADWSAPTDGDHRDSRKTSRVKAFVKILVPSLTSLFQCVYLIHSAVKSRGEEKDKGVIAVYNRNQVPRTGELSGDPVRVLDVLDESQRTEHVDISSRHPRIPQYEIQIG
jgi:hypothetical protein